MKGNRSKSARPKNTKPRGRVGSCSGTRGRVVQFSGFNKISSLCCPGTQGGGVQTPTSVMPGWGGGVGGQGHVQGREGGWYHSPVAFGTGLPSDSNKISSLRCPETQVGGVQIPTSVMPGWGGGVCGQEGGSLRSDQHSYLWGHGTPPQTLPAFCGGCMSWGKVFL